MANNIFYCNPDGKLFTGKAKALKYLKEEGNSEDYEKLSILKVPVADQIQKDTYVNKEGKVDLLSWLVDEEVYPEGWKYRTVRNGTNNTLATQICTATGKVFRGRKAAIAFMKENSYSNADIEKLTKSKKRKPQFSVKDEQEPEVSTEEAPPVPSRSGENKHLMLKLMKNATNALKSK